MPPLEYFVSEPFGTTRTKLHGIVYAFLYYSILYRRIVDQDTGYQPYARQDGWSEG